MISCELGKHPHVPCGLVAQYRLTDGRMACIGHWTKASGANKLGGIEPAIADFKKRLAE